MVNIDYEGKKDGVAFAGGTAANQQLVIGSNSFIAGFESGLIGVNPGETVDLNFHLHQAYREITLVRVKNKEVTVELAFWCFAGITEDEESQKLMLEDWELKYGRFNWKERRKKR